MEIPSADEVVEMNDKLKSKDIDYLFRAILALENQNECYNFFEDLCTISEIQAMAQRMTVAKMLKDKHTYAEISLKTGASAATISRVAKCLNYGAEGYKTILMKLGDK